MSPPSKHTLFEKKVWNLFARTGEIIEVQVLKISGKSQAWKGYLKFQDWVVTQLNDIFAPVLVAAIMGRQGNGEDIPF